LHLLTGYQVSRLVTTSGNSNAKVMGVNFSSGNGANIQPVLTRKEVILAAGALHTPQILQLSGIGDPTHLSTLGIKCIVDLPGVGANYQDHPLLVTAQISRQSPTRQFIIMC
jgi:choline dehydrogenase-like flavoprotein